MDHSPILIVDDHADTADMLRRYLSRKGFPATVAPDGQAALRMLAQHRPRCVILDETMPGLTGLQVLRYLRTHSTHRDLPVFFYSAAFDHSKQVEARTLGARGWFVKGISRLSDLMDGVIAACHA